MHYPAACGFLKKIYFSIWKSGGEGDFSSVSYSLKEWKQPGVGQQVLPSFPYGLNSTAFPRPLATSWIRSGVLRTQTSIPIWETSRTSRLNPLCHNASASIVLASIILIVIASIILIVTAVGLLPPILFLLCYLRFLLRGYASNSRWKLVQITSL